MSNTIVANCNIVTRLALQTQERNVDRITVTSRKLSHALSGTMQGRDVSVKLINLADSMKAEINDKKTIFGVADFDPVIKLSSLLAVGSPCSLA